MDSDRIGGIGHQLLGRLMGMTGRVLGDAKLQTDGARERERGKRQNDAGCARETAGALSIAELPAEHEAEQTGPLPAPGNLQI